MKWLMIALASVISFSCPVISYDDTLEPENACYKRSHNTVSVRACKESEACVVGDNLGVCKPDTPVTTVFPGDFCDNVDYICIGTCVESVCKGSNKGDYCKGHHECDLGLACMSNFCETQIKIGD